MTTTPAPSSSRAPRAPFWARGTRGIEIAIVLVMAVAIVVEFVIAAIAMNVAGLLSAAVVAAGLVVGYRYQPYAGLALVVASPLVAAGLGWIPIHNWSIACFAAFLFTLRGLPGSLTGISIGIANFAASSWAAGTLSVNDNPEASIAGGAALVAAATGSAIRGQRQYLAQIEQRTLDAIATREAAVDRSVAEERVRIARDLHDSIGHKIAVLSMHLGAAEVHLPDDAEAVASELQAARSDVQSVLRETQEILRVLRIGTETTTVTPTPDHGRIPGLVTAYRAAGGEVDAHLSGLDRPLGQSTSAATFRIVQEALTNAERHGVGVVSVHVDVADDAVSIEVVNLRRTDGVDTSGGGNGLVGMRERAESAGGSLDVHTDARLFSVRAHLPTNKEVSA